MLTQAQKDALEWLRKHNGDGCFDQHQVLLAGGETAPVMRSTWNALEAAGEVEFYGGNNGRRRLRCAAR